ncbi:LysM peptidoglycan-binding domain-containing protein [Rossellomorea oryzaecorticis]|uniref:LysM peptidoglycan-binding domain-containing protein n=1 Tax=Rossellomorea oryzaecorticis TaxID=1396505 RepID=A0ABW8VPB7_9BACI
MKKTILSVTATAILSTGFVSSASAGEYKVKPRDSLWSIASQHKVPLANIKQWNQLKSDLIYPDQVLKVTSPISSPPPKASPPKQTDSVKTTYTVKPGDTLGRIALMHSVTVKDIMRLNNLKTDLIFPGQKFVISGKENRPQENTTTPAKPQTPVATPTVDSGAYKIKPGDTLSGISLKFNVTVQDIKSWNQLKSDTIYAGQTLQIKKQIESPVWPLPSDSAEENPKPDTNSKDTVSQAKALLGTPYLWGGSTTSGFDCSGFIYYVLKQTGSSIGRYSSEGYYNRSYYIHTPSPGDLVFFENTYKKGISHMGIYLGNNEFIHAGDNGVVVTSLDNPYWKSKFDGYKRFY